MNIENHVPIRLQQGSQIMRLPVVRQTVVFIAVAVRWGIDIVCEIECLVEFRYVFLVQVGELKSVLGVFAEGGKKLPVSFGGRVVRRDVRDGEVVPHLAFGEGAIAATVLFYVLVIVPAAEEDAASAC